MAQSSKRRASLRSSRDDDRLFDHPMKPRCSPRPPPRGNLESRRNVKLATQHLISLVPRSSAAAIRAHQQHFIQSSRHTIENAPDPRLHESVHREGQPTLFLASGPWSRAPMQPSREPSVARRMRSRALFLIFLCLEVGVSLGEPHLTGCGLAP